MCHLAGAGIEGLSVSAIEIERGGVSYTVDTLRSLHADDPQAQLTLILGADVASTLGSWREPSELLALADVAVAARPGATMPAPLPGERVSVLEMPEIAISSSLVRERAARGEPIEQLVGAAVAGYISEHGLYGAPARTGV